MDYKEMWIEQISWLEKSIDYLLSLKEGRIGEEKQRIINKVDGMKTALKHMKESEKIYAISQE
ncbi:hypothetical protein AAGG74_16745 [Bacillus mexicanus]|uniref:hypothetical protein n=1 Tax=Bacillus mexicanus TaxID=2834415 RepID=UPI003D22BA60